MAETSNKKQGGRLRRLLVIAGVGVIGVCGMLTLLLVVFGDTTPEEEPVDVAAVVEETAVAEEESEEEPTTAPTSTSPPEPTPTPEATATPRPTATPSEEELLEAEIAGALGPSNRDAPYRVDLSNGSSLLDVFWHINDAEGDEALLATAQEEATTILRELVESDLAFEELTMNGLFAREGVEDEPYVWAVYSAAALREIDFDAFDPQTVFDAPLAFVADRHEAMIGALDPLVGLDLAIEAELGGSNRGVADRVLVTTLEDALIIQWAINDNLSTGWIFDGAQIDAAAILEIVRNASIEYQELVLSGTFSLVDALGNAAEDDIIIATYSKDTIEQINFEGFNHNNVFLQPVVTSIWMQQEMLEAAAED